MLALSQTPFKNTSQLVNSTLDTFEYYGFKPAESIPCTKANQNLCMVRDLSYVLPHEQTLVNVTKKCLQKGAHLDTEPRLVYNTDKIAKGAKSSTISLHVIGTDSTTAEITLISTIHTLLKKLQIQDYTLHINSVGDRDSKTRFVRDLAAYMRSVAKDLPTYAKKDMENKSPLLALVHLAEQEHPIARTAPNPMEYLNDESRVRLRKILEYMEHVGLCYELNPSLVGSSDCWSHTIFEVRIPNGDVYVPIVCGGRYNTLARRGFNKKLYSAGAIIEHEVRGKSSLKKRRQIKPKFFVSYLGHQARMRAFAILEDLHNAGIPVAKSVAHSYISGQIEDSERLKLPYIIIIGHKEALENTAIVRNTTTRIQRTVPVTQLVSYLSRLKV